ncbi:P-loop containing nucleoside triphosphate hydrolase protein [Suillus paluster]|uniref:P-loop containing nucleoside triphosphate hydrolase protein n=1 Tax=Suillus paluster TaxID=48578 RepID=UPI001B85E4F4|nr:P-loop containing nucleoside triphosphate hydrolase protein [Suillus paluster]KAG1740122.1 P-loop containing nucleoside triphosphate hydrolase protein [Suillus paluster]
MADSYSASQPLTGLLLGSKFFVMEISAMHWVTRFCNIAFSRVLSQDKSWFDHPENGAAKLTQVIMKDGDDACMLIAVVLGQIVAVGAMMTTGLMAKCEVRNKRAREEVARVYYKSILKVRGIHAMPLEPVLQDSIQEGHFAVSFHWSEALLFYISAVLITQGTYTYLQMCQVLNLSCVHRLHQLNTLIGENASLVSGGQAQRLQIVHALTCPAKVLILDECTSAPDGANQIAILEMICAAKVGKTTIMVMHKAPVMKICDRVLVVEDGQVQALPVPGQQFSHQRTGGQISDIFH